MKQLFSTLSRPAGWLKVFLLSLLTVSLSDLSWAHPMPNSVVLLTIHANRIDAEVQIPLGELQAAFGHAVNDSSVRLLERFGPPLRDYLIEHIRPQSPNGIFWHVSVGVLDVQETHNPINGTYRELIAQVQLIPPASEDVRRFTFHYDAVFHQVATHKILVSVRQDWQRGQLAEEAPAQVGIIKLDIIHNRIQPLPVNLENGSTWTGLRAMVELGMRHIAEGTDHLLFLLVLLLPAPLLVTGRRWSRFGGVRYSLKRLLLIVTAFTIGHSFTLLLGTLEWVELPSQPVEVLIALSILVSAIHALRPLFPGREPWVAAGFGLIHGLAFADTLTNLHLETGPLVWSLFGFNLGIELMQLGIVALVIPWLILLSQTGFYKAIRIVGALLAGIAALAWVHERISGQANAITLGVEQLAGYAGWLLAGFAVLAMISWWQTRRASSKASLG